MQCKPDTRPGKIIAVIFAGLVLISIFLKVSKGDFNIFFVLAMLFSAAGALSWFCLTRKKAGEAAKIYEDASGRFPDDPALLYNCAMAGLISGDKKFALEKFECFLKKYPSSPLVDKAGKLSESLRASRRIKNSQFCYYAEELRKQGKLKEAEQEFRKELSINPNADWAYYGLGLVFAQSGNVEPALENFKKFKEVAPSAKDIRVSIANKLIKMLKDNQRVDVDELILQSVKRSRSFLYWWAGYMGFIFLLFIYFVFLKKIVH